MNVESAFALTPAAIIRLAKVWRALWGVSRSRPASAHAVVGPLLDPVGDVGQLRGPPEDQIRTLPPDARQVLGQVVAEHGGDRHPAATGARLQPDPAGAGIPAVLDADHARGEIDVLDPERPQLAKPQPGIEGGGPYRPVLDLHGTDQRLGFPGRCVAFASAPDSRQLQPRAWVYR
jgi:hypothetical protein